MCSSDLETAGTTIENKESNNRQAFANIGMAFGRNPFTNDVSIVKNDNSIRQALRNLVMTSPGEIPFNKNVGCQVNAMLFEPLDGFTADTIKDEIINTINQYEKRVQLRSVTVTPYGENSKLAVTIVYQVVGIPIVEEVKFVLQRPE